MFLITSATFQTNVPGNWPTPKLEWSPSTNPGATPVWIDITPQLRRWSINRGRRNWLSAMNPGTATFDLDNTAGDFTPSNASATYYPNLIPGKRVRFSVSFGGVTYPRYVGFTTGYVTTWKNTDSQVTFNCVDGLGLLNLVQLDAVYAMAVLSDSPTAYYRFLETGGTTAADSSPNANTATYSASGITWGQQDPITDGSDHAIQFDGHTGYVTTPPITYGAAGWSVEVWFKIAAVPGFPAILIGSDKLSGAQAPYWYLAFSSFGAGEIYLQVGRTNGFAGSFVSTSGTTYADNAWHQVVFTWAASNLESLYVDGALVSSSSGLAYQSFPIKPITIGPADEASGGSTVVVNMAEVAIWTTTVITATQVLNHYNARTAWLNDRTDTRIARILDAAGWSSSDRNVSVGVSTLTSADDAKGKTALTAINEATTTDNGLMFVDQSGRLAFLGRNAFQTSPYNASQGTFGDNVAEIAYPMGDGKITLDDQDLWTRIQVQKKGGALFQATASTATVNQYYTVRQPATVNSLTVSDSEAQQLAYWLLNQSSVPVPRVDTLNMKGTAGNLANILPRELGDLVTHRGRPAGVGTVSQQARILGMKESGDLKTRIFQTSWLLFAREVQAMVWNDATYGFWDTYPWGI